MYVLKQGNVHECVFARVTVRVVFFLVRGGNEKWRGFQESSKTSSFFLFFSPVCLLFALFFPGRRSPVCGCRMTIEEEGEEAFKGEQVINDFFLE